jgi:hypothetical protein
VRHTRATTDDDMMKIGKIVKFGFKLLLGKRTRNNQVLVRARATDDVAFKHDVMLNTRKVIILLFIHV